MKLYSSTFISVILGFLVLLGASGQPIERIENPDVPNFSYTIKPEGPIESGNIRIEVFEDLTCGRCGHFVEETLPKIKDLERETDVIDLRLYFIPDINDDLLNQAALSLKCAADQERFWDMHKKLHEKKEELNTKSFITFSKELELNAGLFKDCMESEAHQKSVEEDIRYASEKGIIFKPTIVINGYQLIGDQPFENIQKIIGDFLEEKRENDIKGKLPEQTTDLQFEIENVIPAEIDL